MALAILAAPAFFESTRPVFTEYRGEWALISVSRMRLFRLGSTLSLLVLCRDVTNRWSCKYCSVLFHGIYSFLMIDQLPWYTPSARDIVRGNPFSYV